MWNILGVIGKIGGVVTGIDWAAVMNVMQSIGSSIVKYWQYWLIAVLIAVNLFTGYELKHTRDSLAKEVSSHAQDIKDFKDAQAQANAQAQATKITLMKESKANADQADANYSVLLSRYRSSLVRFAPHQGGARSAGDSQLSTAQGGDGPSSNTDLPKSLTITGSDADICAVNTARLQVVHDWAITQLKEVNK